MKNIVHKNRFKKIHSKFKFQDGVIQKTSPVSVTSSMIFFINIGPNLAKNIPDLGINPLNYMSATASHTIFSSPVTNIDIIRII